MITVAGEALMDIVADAAGTLTPLPGGAPFNVARIVSRLGEQSSYLGLLSADQFGARLRAELLGAGVQLATPAAVSAPTTLAIAQLDAGGSADYHFYVQGPSAVALRRDDVPPGLLDGCRALALGALSIVYEPIRSTLLELVEQAPASVLVLLDPNCRPHAIPDLESYRRTIERLVKRADMIKASVEDLELICPARDPLTYAAELVARGPAAVVVTDGPNSVTLITRDGLRSIPVPSVEVVDTIGAGDAVVAGLLAWLAGHPDVDPRAAALEVWQGAVGAAVEVAAAVCTTHGATLPDGFSWIGGRAPLMR
jgi:fructokinase